MTSAQAAAVTGSVQRPGCPEDPLEAPRSSGSLAGPQWWWQHGVVTHRASMSDRGLNHPIFTGQGFSTLLSSYDTYQWQRGCATIAAQPHPGTSVTCGDEDLSTVPLDLHSCSQWPSLCCCLAVTATCTFRCQPLYLCPAWLRSACMVLNLALFSLLALTSALTVHVLGNLTVVGNLILSRLLFGSHLSALSYMGIALTLSGMFLYHHCEFVASWAVRRGLWQRGQPDKGL